MENVRIRVAQPEEVDLIAGIEGACFPPAEAASLEEIRTRMGVFPENFLVAELDGEVIGFIDGCTTDQPVLGDELYHDAGLHKPDGEIQTVFGLNVLPEYRRRGVASQLIQALLKVSGERGKKAVILTCKERLIPLYEGNGFENHGLSDSTHGGAQWYDMQQWF